MSAEDWTAWGRRKQILGEVEEERARQIVLWGVHGHAPFAPEADQDGLEGYRSKPGPTAPELVAEYYEIPTAGIAKANCQAEHSAGDSSWIAILVEELAEAVEEAALGRVTELRTELVQTAAVVVAWIEDLDRAAVQAREDATESAYARHLQKGSE